MAAALKPSLHLQPVMLSQQVAEIGAELKELKTILSALAPSRTRTSSDRILSSLMGRVSKLESALAESTASKADACAEGKIVPIGEDLEAAMRRLAPYFKLLAEHPHVLGVPGTEADLAAGESIIITDPKEIMRVEKEKDQRVGIIAQTKWHIAIVDALKLPNGSEGVQIRFFTQATLTGLSGAATLPIMKDGRIMLCLIHRPTQRTDREDHGWRFEIPRGSTDPEAVKKLIGGKVDEAVDSRKRAMEKLGDATATRETREETGAESDKPLRMLGRLDPNTGCMQEVVHIKEMEVHRIVEAQRDEMEQSMSTRLFTEEELFAAIHRGYISATLVGGKQVNVPLRDGFLFAALVHREAARRAAAIA